MRTQTADFNTENSKTEKSPCFIIVFDEVAGTKFCSNTFGDWSSTYKKYITNILVEGNEVDLNESFVKLSRLTFTLIEDSSLTVLGLLNGNKILGQKVTCKFGYDVLDEADFITFQDFYIYDYVIDETLNSYTFYCEESSSLIKKLFENDVLRVIPESALAEDLTAAENDITVIESDDFYVYNVSTTPINWGLIINDELITYDSVDDATETFTVNVAGDGTRGFGLSVAADHSLGVPVKEFYYFEYYDGVGQYEYQHTFVQALLTVLCTVGGAGSSGDTHDFDVGKADFGIGLTGDEIDVEQIEREGYHYHMTNYTAAENTTWEHYRLELFKRENAKDLIKRIAKIFNGWWYFSENKLCLKILNIPELTLDFVSISAHQVLDDDKCKIISIETLNDKLINEYDLYHDLLITTDNYGTLTNLDITESQTAYGTYPKKELQMTGLLSGANSTHLHIADRHALFWGNISQKIKVRALSKYCLYEPFDMIKFDSSFMPNICQNSRTSDDEPCMVLKQTIGIDNNEFINEIDLLAFETINKANAMYSVVSEASTFDRATVQYSATFDDTLEAEDGYHTESFGGNVDYVYVTVRIVWPDSAAADEQGMIKIGLLAYENVPGYTEVARNAIKIRYHTTWDKTEDYILPLLVMGEKVDRVKVDWFYCFHGVVGDQHPTSVTINKIRAVTVDY